MKNRIFVSLIMLFSFCSQLRSIDIQRLLVHLLASINPTNTDRWDRYTLRGTYGFSKATAVHHPIKITRTYTDPMVVNMITDECDVVDGDNSCLSRLFDQPSGYIYPKLTRLGSKEIPGHLLTFGVHPSCFTMIEAADGSNSQLPTKEKNLTIICLKNGYMATFGPLAETWKNPGNAGNEL